MIIISLVIFQVLGFGFSFPHIYIQLSTILILVSALGLLYSVYLKKKSLLREELDRKRQRELLGQILRRVDFCSAKDILEALNNQGGGDARLIGEILVDMGAITDEQLEHALGIQKKRAELVP